MEKVHHSVGQANVWLLLLSIVAIYGCYALRALRCSASAVIWVLPVS